LLRDGDALKDKTELGYNLHKDPITDQESDDHPHIQLFSELKRENIRHMMKKIIHAGGGKWQTR
jgi:hypothetical protein